MPLLQLRSSLPDAAAVGAVAVARSVVAGRRRRRAVARSLRASLRRRQPSSAPLPAVVGAVANRRLRGGRWRAPPSSVPSPASSPDPSPAEVVVRYRRLRGQPERR
uniref:Uncharacterized protein n=1 Tax=Oryza barthii TaxID=65489 RepID=A0A0D3FLR7_9ORYZ